MSRLRLAELPAMFWVLLSGRESRARLRFILASRRPAVRERRRARLAAAVDEMIQAEAAKIRRELPSPGHQRLRAPGSGLPEAMPPLAAAFGGVTMAEAQAALYEFAGFMREHRSMSLNKVQNCGDGHEALWVEGRGRVCLTCERSATVSVNGTILQIPLPGGDQT